jgi:hypothetical protein
VRVVLAVGAKLVGGDDREQLAALHEVALLDEEALQPPGHLRRHDDVVGGHDAGQDQRGRPGVHVVVRAGGRHEKNENDDASCLAHLRLLTFKHMN